MDYLFPTASPLDPQIHSSTFSIPSTLINSPKPPYPIYSTFRFLISESTYNASLSSNLVFSFCFLYLLFGQIANHKTRKNNIDLTKKYHWLNAFIIFHNLLLATYSAWTFAGMFPDVLHFFVQGWRIAGWQGK